MAAATWFTDQVDSCTEEAKSATGCCNVWIQESGWQLGIRQRCEIFVVGQFVDRESRHVILEPLNQETPETRRCEIAKHFLGFLNTNEGGTVYFGVNFKGELQGLPQKEETTLKNDVEIVAKSINKMDHSYHYALHFFRVYRHNMRAMHSATAGETTSKGRGNVPLVCDKTRPPLSDLIFPILAVSKCRKFPIFPYTSTLLDTTVAFFRRDGSTSPLSMAHFDSEEKWRKAHASLYLQQRREEETPNFQTLTRLKDVIFTLSDKLVQYEKNIQ